MDFSDSPKEAAFRAEAKAWLASNVPSAAELDGLDPLTAAKLWQKRKYDAGWACITWPKEFGGRGASAIEQVIWNQEESKFSGLPGGYRGVLGFDMLSYLGYNWSASEFDTTNAWHHSLWVSTNCSQP